MATATNIGTELDLIAHLLRRTGFGSTPGELEEAGELGYEGTLDQLFNPGDADPLPVDLIRRYHADHNDLRIPPSSGSFWMYRLVTTKTPFEEKIALFWHRVFATGQTKVIQGKVMISQIDMFRKYGLGSFRELLIQLSKDPAMIRQPRDRFLHGVQRLIDLKCVSAAERSANAKDGKQDSENFSKLTEPLFGQALGQIKHRPAHDAAVRPCLAILLAERTLGKL